MPTKRRWISIVMLVLGLGGCGLRDCQLGIASRDCGAPGSVATTFPQDDAICRSYGLAPDTHDYAMCRHAKSRLHAATARETDYGFLQNPLTPDFRR